MRLGNDVPPIEIRLPSESVDEALAAAAAGLDDHLRSRMHAMYIGGRPLAESPGVAWVVGALLAVRPLKDSVDSLIFAMAMPNVNRAYEPVSRRLAEFADAVNWARTRVDSYAMDCWDARRAVVKGWGKRAGSVVRGAEEWSEAMHELSVVVAEAVHAEQRLAVFDAGVSAKIREAERASAESDFLAVERAGADVVALRLRHSAPTTLACAGCE